MYSQTLDFFFLLSLQTHCAALIVLTFTEAPSKLKINAFYEYKIISNLALAFQVSLSLMFW
jgi:hypothetical protein